MEFKGNTEKLHAVTYAGIVFIQDTEFYEDSEKCNVLDADHVGIIKAEANGLLFSKAPEMLEMLKTLKDHLKDVLEEFGSESAEKTKAIRDCNLLIKQATEL